LIDRRGFVAGSLLASLPAPDQAAGSAAGPPHFFLSMTDDQADEPLSLMNNWRERIAEVGIQFASCYVPLSECEPSRATFQTGQTAHNHKARGYATFRPGEGNTLPVWMQQAGYFTAFVGKYFTDFGQENDPIGHVPPGWDWFTAACDPNGPFRYRGPQCNENGEIVGFCK
jgi:arylsulfatase A-like enzyme